MPAGPPPSIAASLRVLADSISHAVLGKPELVKLALVALLAEGHLLIEDVPGVGKTLLARSLARSLDCSFHRIQFTPDLLPSDLIGTSIFNQNTSSFSFQPGPLFAQVVLADEINRATPRTQSALLEAMQEHQVTVDGHTRPLGPPFLVVATQNPFEFEGTYPLPESQLDRFLMRLKVGYPDRKAERAILTQHRSGDPALALSPVMAAAEVVKLQEQVRQIRVDDAIADYVLDLVSGTRSHPDITLGGSTRAALALYRAAQALALVESRDYVTPDDVKQLAAPVLAHRLLSPRLRQGTRTDEAAEALIAEVVGRTAVPA